MGLYAKVNLAILLVIVTSVLSVTTQTSALAAKLCPDSSITERIHCSNFRHLFEMSPLAPMVKRQMESL